MPKRLALAALALAFAGPALVAPAPAAEPGPLMIVETKAKFEDVKDDVVNAVTRRGLVIDYTAHIGTMLDRTAKDVGAAKKVYARAEAVQFCSATLSRRMMEADPGNIAFCPYVIVIYSLAGDPATVHVGYRRPQQAGTPASRAALKAVDELLLDIVQEAVKK